MTTVNIGTDALYNADMADAPCRMVAILSAADPNPKKVENFKFVAKNGFTYGKARLIHEIEEG